MAEHHLISDMKKLYCIIVTLFVTLFAANALAFSPPPAPEKGFYVSDQSGKMSQSDILQLNQKIDRISKVTKNEFGVLLLQDMGGDNIEDVANTTFKSWGIGKRGLDNGCLIVVAIKERKSRIETGKGVEGEVTDLQASDILRKNLNPHLKSGDFSGGFTETLDALSSLIESRHAKKAEPVNGSGNPSKTEVPVRSASCSSGPASFNSENELMLFFVAIGAIAVIYGYVTSKRKSRELKQSMIDAELEYLTAQKEAHRIAIIKQEADAKLQAENKKKAEAKALAAETSLKAIVATFKDKDPLKEKVTVVRKSVAVAAPVDFLIIKDSFSAKTQKQTVDNQRRLKDDSRRAKELADDRRNFEESQRRLNQDEDARRCRRDQEEADRRRRQDEEDESRRRSARSLSSSSSSWGSSSSDSSSSWGSSSSDSGSFGGGDSGGGGSSSDW
ncbi:COG1512 Beta-propeller domains of methanol dehydrogenase type [uncultured Caudovirales phage]|uniref:COG1512 Beta-propeller domains of methanol dehydrogenase type n=1 Tax=uncultured Caudovirales phage TaxID=2100421 RepID=A0A6J5RHE4_9CAUD|nr:COG1512 Beta-propeller domains of methanol dehydrogenase type [uncultured Caudovirales phage]